MTKLKNKSIVHEFREGHTIKHFHDAVVDGVLANNASKNGGGDCNASVFGCNANNANAGRTLNANNSVANDNANYAGGFATNVTHYCDECVNDTHDPTSCLAKTNISEERVSNGVHVHAEYGSFTDLLEDTTEMGAKSTHDIWKQLAISNSKRKLKSLRKFYLNREIVEYSVKRTCKGKDTEAKRYFYKHSSEIADRIISDISNKTYKVGEIRKIIIKGKHKTSKERRAKIYHLYDRCVHSLILTIVEGKLKRLVLRNNYSNMEGRGIFCNDKSFSMANKLRHASTVYGGSYVLTTDIRKFYQSIKPYVIMRTLSRVIKDKTTIWLLNETFSASMDLPIGCCLSPIIADIVMNDYDNIVLHVFKPKFYGAFGDNRVYFASRGTLRKVLSFTRKYYHRHYRLELKDDYQIRKAKDGFTFCKTNYRLGYVRMRGELKRRVIKSMPFSGSFWSYYGLLIKNDARRLSRLVFSNRIKEEMTERKSKEELVYSNFSGKRIKMDKLVGKKVFITNFKKVENGKDSKYYYLLQMIYSNADGEKELCVVANGCEEIKKVCDTWLLKGDNEAKLVTIDYDAPSFFFKEYHMTNKEALDAIASKLNIDLSKLDE